MNKQKQDILPLFDRIGESFFSHEELYARLSSGDRLRIKYSIKYDGSDINLGHAPALWLMRGMQNLGHTAVVVIADQPQDRKSADNYIEQLKEILRFDDPALIEVQKRSDFYARLPLNDVTEYLSSVAPDGASDIFMDALFSPLLQGFDTAYLETDIAICSQENAAAEKAGREYQAKSGKKASVLVVLKDFGFPNITLAHSAREKFSRIMQGRDEDTDSLLRLQTDMPLADIDAHKAERQAHPRRARMDLAESVVSRYHGHQVADWEREWFENTVSKGLVPEEVPTLAVIDGHMSLAELIMLTRSGRPKSDAVRVIRQGVEISSRKMENPEENLNLRTNDILKVGKSNWYRIEVTGVNEIETERLKMKPLQVQDIDLLQKYLPEWELVKYLTDPRAPKAAQQAAAEILKRVITQPEPKEEWIWKIQPKLDPEKIIGIAHLRRDEALGNQNVWLDAAYRDDFYLEEILAELNGHAFESLGFTNMVIKDAFAHAAGTQDMDVLRRRFLNAETGTQVHESGAGWGFSREGWRKMQEWYENTRSSPRMKTSRRSQARVAEKIQRQQFEQEALRRKQEGERLMQEEAELAKKKKKPENDAPAPSKS